MPYEMTETRKEAAGGIEVGVDQDLNYRAVKVEREEI